VSGIFAVVEGQRGQLSLAFSAKKNRPGLLFVPSEALGEDLYLVSAVLWLHENCERGVSPFALQYGGGRRDQVAAFLVQPWALRFPANSVQTLFTFALLVNSTCSTSVLYSMSEASFVSARSLTLS
jgi:hypothetical protein